MTPTQTLTSTPKRVTFAGLSLRDYQEYPQMGQETVAFSGAVYDEETGESIGTLTNQGVGGPNAFSANAAAGWKRWAEACEQFTPITSDPERGYTFSTPLEEALADVSGVVWNSRVRRQGTRRTAQFVVATPEEIVAKCGAVEVSSMSSPSGVSGMALWRRCVDQLVGAGSTVVYAEAPRSSQGIEVFVIAPE